MHEGQALNTFSHKYLDEAALAETPATKYHPLMQEVHNTVQKKMDIAKEGMKVTQQLEKLKKMRSKEALDALVNNNQTTPASSLPFLFFLSFLFLFLLFFVLCYFDVF